MFSGDGNYKGEDSDVNINVAMAEGRLGGVNLQVGRLDDVFADGYIYDGEHDAVRVSYGDRIYVAGAYGKPTDLNEDETVFKNSGRPKSAPIRAPLSTVKSAT